MRLQSLYIPHPGVLLGFLPLDHYRPTSSPPRWSEKGFVCRWSWDWEVVVDSSPEALEVVTHPRAQSHPARWQLGQGNWLFLQARRKHLTTIIDSSRLQSLSLLLKFIGELGQRGGRIGGVAEDEGGDWLSNWLFLKAWSPALSVVCQVAPKLYIEATQRNT